MLNSLKYTKQLENVGFTRKQAETHIMIMTAVVDKNLATKQDMKDLEIKLTHEMEKLEYKMTIKLGTIVTIAIAAMAAIVKFF